MKGPIGKEPITAAELMARLEKDSAYIARIRAQEEERRCAMAKSQSCAKPLLADLAAAGYPVNHVSELLDGKTKYRKAIPILIYWLPRIIDPMLKDDVVRALTVPWARPFAAPILVEEFQKVTGPQMLDIRWAIANALSLVADDSVFLDLVRLVTDPGYGKAREMLALALTKVKNPEAVVVLIHLLNDDDVVGHAVIALGKLKASEAHSALEALVNHPKAWIRKEVRKALSRIEGKPR